MFNSIYQVLAEASKQLSAVTDTPRLDAEILLSFLLHQPRSYFHAHPDATLTVGQAAQYAAYIARRAQGEPVAYITRTPPFSSF